jgi:pyruvate formate lyase activating enzyme
MRRKRILIYTGLICLVICGVYFIPKFLNSKLKATPILHEAMFYTKLDDEYIQCNLCPHNCTIPNNAVGVCRVRKNIKGKLYTLTYAKPCSLELSPIEKAPFFHYLPGHFRLALATAGCNIKCKHCQNWHISQRTPDEVTCYYIPPEDIIKLAKEKGVKIICFTFTEPIIFYEYMYDIAKLAKKNGLKTVVVSGGYVNEEPLKELLKVIDAIKIDLKSFDDKFYREQCFAELVPILKGLKVIKDSGKWLEIVNLIIPTLNDSPSQIKKMCEWIKTNLGEDVPLHFTRFFPAYKTLHLPPTPPKTLELAYNIAKKVGLKYVYIGNLPNNPKEDTYCPACGKLLIDRRGYEIIKNNIRNSRCGFCKAEIAGIFK